MPETRRAMAIGCHPDDIEFMMAGTLILLKEVGWEIHYMNVANGSCGTAQHSRDEIVAIRGEEARKAAEYIGAIFHPSLVDDLAVYYEPNILARLCAVIRQVQPNIILTHSPWEYMEDHSNTCRLAVTAAFCRGMRNFLTQPSVPPTHQAVTIYHALPYGLRDPLRKRVRAGLYVDITGVIEQKKQMLAFHRSQKEWLDISQGLGAYLNAMVEISQEIGRLSKKFPYAEGWRRHLHLGFCGPDDDPLAEALGQKAYPDLDYEAQLNRF
ncbi:MAG: PIG-L family deacetylase [Candidatus Omnitrophica bacterium]|nr:PIG-L family deacetylase [Candidatus Omnitrophota bacterium]